MATILNSIKSKKDTQTVVMDSHITDTSPRMNTQSETHQAQQQSQHQQALSSSPTRTTHAQPKVKSKYQGTTIKNVNGKGDDYTPFVGCEDINDLIANLNNTSDHSSSTSDVVMDGNADADSYGDDVGDVRMEHGRGMSTLPLTTQHSQSQSLYTSNNHHVIESPTSLKSNSTRGGDGNIHIDNNEIMGSPSSVNLFSPQPTQMPSNLQQQQQQQQQIYDEDDNSTIATQGTNTTLPSYQKSSSITTTKKKKVRIVIDDDDNNNNNTNENENDFLQTMMEVTEARRRQSQQKSSSASSIQSSSSSKRKQKSSSSKKNQQQNNNDQWETFWSSEHDCPYYYNKITKEVTWDNPIKSSLQQNSSLHHHQPHVYEDEYVPMADYTKTSPNKISSSTTAAAKTTSDIDHVLQSANGDIDNILNNNSNHNHNHDSSSIQSSSSIHTKNTNGTTSSSYIHTTTSWERYWSDDHGCEYFHNPNTGETRWDDPTLQQRRKQKKLQQQQQQQQQQQRNKNYRSKNRVTGSTNGSGSLSGSGSRIRGASTGTNGNGSLRSIQSNTSSTGGGTGGVIIGGDAGGSGSYDGSGTSAGASNSTYAQYSCVGSDYYEDDELVEISDFTKSKGSSSNGNGGGGATSATTTTTATGTADSTSSGNGSLSNKKDSTISSEKGVGNLEGSISTPTKRNHRTNNNTHPTTTTKQQTSLKLPKSLKRLSTKIRRKLNYTIQQYQLRYKSIYDITNDVDRRSITGADLAHQRRVNLLRKRRRKKRMKRGLVLMVVLVCFYWMMGGFNSGGSAGSAGNDSGNDLDVTSSITTTSNEDHQPTKSESVSSHTRTTTTTTTSTTSTTPTEDPRYEELKKLRESLELIQSTMMQQKGSGSVAVGGGGPTKEESDEMNKLGHKLNELREYLENVNGGKGSDEVNAQIDGSKKSEDKEAVENAKNTSSNNQDASDENKTENASNDVSSNKGEIDDKKEKLGTKKISSTSSQSKKKSSENESFSNMTNILSYIGINTSATTSQSGKNERTASPLETITKSDALGENNKNDKTSVISKSVSRIEDKSSTVKNRRSGSSYFGKFQNVIQTLGLALDVHLDIESMADENDDEMVLSNDRGNDDHRIENQIGKILASSTKNTLTAMKKVSDPIQRHTAKTATQISQHVKKTMPNVHRSISIGATKSAQAVDKVATVVKNNVPAGAKIVAKNSKKALVNAKDAMHRIGENEQVIAAKDKMVATANTVGKHAAKETVKFVRTLDYDGLVEKGVISKSVIFPDTRAMHCTMPIFKRVNKRCSGVTNPTTEKASSDTGFPNRIFSRKKVVSPSTEGGWSTPIWKSCENGNCQQPVSTSYQAPDRSDDGK